MPKAIFAGCARSCAPFLDGVLANVEALGSTYDAFELVIVENDSADDTRNRIEEFARSRPNVSLIDADGLDEKHPIRGDRLAVARNIYMDAVRDDKYSDCDDLVVLDFDDVNCQPIDVEAFRAARRWLWDEPHRRGVFANSAYFYYDIWPLRHPTWCPDDCWRRVRQTQRTLGFDEAVRRHVARLQIPIPPATAPIVVDSAFGGLGIYRREATLQAAYAGLFPEGDEVCDHVAFNRTVKGSDGVLAIYPPLQNQAPLEHVIASLRGTKKMIVEYGGSRCALIGPPRNQLQGLLETNPLYKRRLPALARMVFDDTPEETFIDAGANIGDTIALARLAGARMPVIASEASLRDCKFLWANIKRLPRLFGDARLVWGRVGAIAGSGEKALEADSSQPAGARLATVSGSAPVVRLAGLANDRPVALLKANAEGFGPDGIASELEFLRAKQPILWLEDHTASQTGAAKWRDLIGSMAGQWNHAILFDNFGFAIADGETGRMADQMMDLMTYARRQRERPGYKPALHHIDVALFPTRFGHIFHEFRQVIPELIS